MTSLCGKGFQGFPVQVTGWIGEPDKEKYSIPNDISVQFSPSQIPMTYTTVSGSFSINGTNTFFIGGSQYFVAGVRLCKAKQEGLSSNSKTVIAELHIWGFPTATSLEQQSLAVFVIPIFQGPVDTDAGKTLIKMITGQAVQLQSVLPQGDFTQVVRYSSCIETDKKFTIKIIVAYWSSGLEITQESAKKLPMTFADHGVPQQSDYKLLTSYQLSEQGKGNRIFSVKNGLLQPYSNVTALSTSTNEFQIGFRVIQGFKLRTSTSQARLNSYTCIPIDRRRDIKDGKILLDPENGRPLNEELDAINNETPSNQEASIPPRKIMETIFIILGIILGITMLGGVMYVLLYVFVTRRTFGAPAPDPIVAKCAEAIGPLAAS